MKLILEHVVAHPIRLLVTTAVVLVISCLAAGIAIILALDAGRAANVAACLQINELRRELYVAAADLGVPQDVRVRFLPTKDCV